jgi:hypothetical protein
MVVEEIPAQGSAFGKIAMMMILREGIGRAGIIATEAMDFDASCALLCGMIVA